MTRCEGIADIAIVWDVLATLLYIRQQDFARLHVEYAAGHLASHLESKRVDLSYTF